MSRIPDAFIDDLIARIDIVEVIGARVALKRAGREYQALCPFHDERSPSFTVSPNKQFYHCFGCGAHGTALRFLMEFDRLEFLDALEELAKRAGIEVPRATRQQNQNHEFADLQGICDEAARFFRQQLTSSPRALQYLKQRGVDAETRERFVMGYAPDAWEALRSALGTTEERMHLLERAGLLSRNDAGRVYDKFRDRVIFPIHDRRGRVIAFGGRVLDQDDSPKYLNSPETPLFHKGRELYGLWQVRQAHSTIPHLIVVEGYMDVVTLFQFGVTTAVATLGTATTADHAELLFRNSADVYFCFDGDRAGRGAAWKAVESILPRMKDGRQAWFLFLPEGEDPDTLVRGEGSAGIEQRLAAATPLSEFFFTQIRQDVNLSTLDGRARLAERCKPALEPIPDGAFRDLMRRHLAELSGIGAPQPTLIPGVRHIKRPPRGGTTGVKRSLVRNAIALLLQCPEVARNGDLPLQFGDLLLPGVGLLLELIDAVRSREGIHTGALLEQFEDREEAPALRKLAAQSLLGDERSWRREFHDALAQLEVQTRAQRIEQLRRLPHLDEDSRVELRKLLAQRAE